MDNLYLFSESTPITAGPNTSEAKTKFVEGEKCPEFHNYNLYLFVCHNSPIPVLIVHGVLLSMDQDCRKCAVKHI